MNREADSTSNKKLLLCAGVLLLLGLLFLNRALFPPEGFALGRHDTRGLFLPWINFIQRSLADGRLPFWNPYEFAGYPFLSNPQVGFFYPPAWLTFILPPNVGLSWYVLLHIWLASVGMLLFVRTMGAKWLGSMISALLYGFSGFAAARIWAGHMGVVATFSWLPWVVLAFVWAVRKKSLWSAVIAGIPVGLAFLAGHTPSFFYICLIWLAFGLYLTIVERQSVSLVARQALAAGIVGLGLAAVQLIPFAELSLNSQRLASSNYNFATDYSFPPSHLITLLIPEFFGEPVLSGYWSVPSFEELTYYAGVMIIIGLILALRRPTALTWFYFILMFSGLWLAMGKYSGFYNLLYGVFPPIRMMRAPGRSAILFLFAGTALVGHIISRWDSLETVKEKQPAAKTIKWILIVAGLAFVAAIGATGATFLAVHPTDTSGRLWHQLGAYSVGLIMLLLIGGILWAYLSRGSGRSRDKRYLAAVLLILIIVDLWQFGVKLVQLSPIDNFTLWEQGEKVIGDSFTRALPWGLSIFEQNGATENSVRSVFGYQALEPSRIVDLASNVPDPRAGAYDVLAISHVLAPTALDQYTDGEKGLELLSSDQGTWVYRRPSALPLARFVYQTEVIPNPSEAIARVNSPEFDPLNIAILDSDPGCDLGSTIKANDSAAIEKSDPGSWIVQTQSSQPGILVLAESMFPGWNVAIDGQPTESLTAYTALKAVCVPPGEHLVEWRFQPLAFLIGGAISMVFLILVGLAIFLERKAASA